MYGHLDVVAESEDEAIKTALGPNVPLPDNGEYLPDSLCVDPDEPVRSIWP
jgi:hypothetical protein